jgi:hypothetical protein
MLLTKPQVSRFFREWSAIVRANGWSHDDSETRRHALLQRAGFASLTIVDKLSGFDRVLAEIKALSQPADLDAQLRQSNMPRTRLIYSCRQKADAPYIAALARDRFHTDDWTSLPVESLEQLRNTLADRAVENHVRRQPSSRPRPSAPESRITFHDLVSGPF